MGSIKNVAKTAKKDQLATAYNQLFESKVSHTYCFVFFFSSVSVLCFNEFCRPTCRGLKAQSQRKNSHSRSKQSKLRISPKRSRQRWWMRYLLGDAAAGRLVCLARTRVLTHGPWCSFTGSTQIHQGDPEERRQDKLPEERRHCELLVHRLLGGRNRV